MDLPIPIMPVGNLFKVTYMGKSQECDWSEMLGLVASITIQLQLHIGGDAKITIKRPCLDWLKDEAVMPQSEIVNAMAVALTPPLTAAPVQQPALPATAPEPKPELVADISSQSKITTAGRIAVTQPVLPRLADLDAVQLDGDDLSSHDEEELSREEDELEHRPDRTKSYPWVVRQDWGPLEEDIYNYIAVNGSASPMLIGQKIGENPIRVGKAVANSKRLEKISQFIHIRRGFKPDETKLTDGEKDNGLHVQAGS